MNCFAFDTCTAFDVCQSGCVAAKVAAGTSLTSCRYIDPGIIRKPMKIAPMTVFQSNPSSK